MTPQVENAAAIRAFDYGAAASFGAVAAALSWLVVPDALPGVAVMILGMGVGIATALPLLGVFSALLGGFEIVVMSFQIGMFAGMMGAMSGASGLLTVMSQGAFVGLVIQFVLHALDRILRGEVEFPATGAVE